jgi:hypothetical protein
MKHCPACNFSFPDFHQVCDFDGTELVPSPKRPSLVNVSTSPSRFRRIAKSPTLLTSAGILALFLGAVLIGYYVSNGKLPAVVKDPSSPSVSVARTAEQLPAQIKTPVPPKRHGRNNTLTSSSAPGGPRQAKTQRSVARRQQGISDDRRAQKSETDLRTRPQPVSDEKGPKLIAILKTTWNVMKKPFKF